MDNKNYGAHIMQQENPPVFLMWLLALALVMCFAGLSDSASLVSSATASTTAAEAVSVKTVATANRPRISEARLAEFISYNEVCACDCTPPHAARSPATIPLPQP